MGADAVAPNTGRSARKAVLLQLKRPQRKRPQRRKARPKRNNLDRKIDNVATEEGLQKGGASRFPLRESGGRAPHYHGHEARQEISRGANRLHGDREIAPRF